MQARALEEKIEKERSRVRSLEEEIRAGQDRMMDQRKKMGGVNAARESNAQVQKQIKVLENRLEKAYVKYNEAVAHNKRLREQIDSLRRERLVFGQIYRKLERELQEKKQKMEAIIDKSNRAYEERDTAIEHMATLKKQAELEQEEFRKRWDKLGQAIKSNRKKLMDLQVAKVEGEREEEKESRAKKAAARAKWQASQIKVVADTDMDKVNTFVEVFEDIKAATGCESVNDLVEKFVKVEEQNFSLFNYVNELNMEVEKLEEQMGDIRGEIAKYRGQGNQHEAQRKKVLADLEERLGRTETKAEEYERKHEAASEAMTTLKEGITTVFERLGCDADAHRAVLGEGGVTDSNLMPYLGVIEQRINEILASYASTQGLDATGTNLAVLLGTGAGAAPAGASDGPAAPVAVPGVNDMLDDDGAGLADDAPLWRGQIETMLSSRRR